MIYALFRVNIFANAGAKAYSNMASSAKKAKNETKQLAGVHDEINNVQSDSNSDSGSGTIAPNLDLSGLDTQLSPWQQKLYDFFKPLIDSWNTYGSGLIEQVKITAGQVGGLISSVWGSFEKIITNGTVYSTLENILAIIGNITEAFANAWNYNGNGDAIIQNLANAFNNLLTAINNVIQSSAFQEWLNNCSNKFKAISDVIASIDWQPLINAVFEVGAVIGELALDGLKAIVEIFKWMVENPEIPTIILAIVAAIKLWSIAQGILNAVMNANPILLIITLIGLLIIAITEIVKNWDSVSAWLSESWEWIKQKAIEIFTAIGNFFTNIFNSIKDFFVNTWNSIKDFFINLCVSIYTKSQEIWNNIVNTISNVWNTIVNKVKEGVAGAWNAITSVFGNVSNWFKEQFSKAWQAVKDVFSSGGAIFDGIKDGILNGLKTVINAIIRGINKVISIPFNGINSALRAIKNVNIAGFQPFSWLGTINVPQIPELAKGGVLYEDTIIKAGEYSNAKNNPEIVTPQNILYETTVKAFSDTIGNLNNSNGQQIRVQVYLGTKNFVDEVIDGINEKTRRTGNSVIKVGG